MTQFVYKPFTGRHFVTTRPNSSFPGMIDEVFKRVRMDNAALEYTHAVPAVNVVEAEGKFEVHLAAPGLEKQDFQISVDKDLLVISVEKEKKAESGEEGRWIRKEFAIDSFKRTFHLDKHIDADHIEAGYAQGILTVILPKKQENVQKTTRLIEIQ